MRIRRVFPFAAGVLVFTLLPAAAARAEGGFGGGALERRKTEREKENWYFSDLMSYKSRSRDLDLLYRFYTRPEDGAAPRVEPAFHVSLSTGLARPAPSPSSGNFGGLGYGGSLHFNHFLSAFTGLPTPNIVPGIFAERLEESGSQGPGLTTRWGPSLRFLARNQQDLAVYLQLRVEKGVVWARGFSASQAELSARMFLLPFLGLEGAFLVDENFLSVRKDPNASRTGYSFAPFIEAGVFRLRARFERERFAERGAAALGGASPRNMRVERRTLSVGVAL